MKMKEEDEGRKKKKKSRGESVPLLPLALLASFSTSFRPSSCSRVKLLVLSIDSVQHQKESGLEQRR